MPHWVSTLEVAQVNKGLHYFGPKVPCTVRLIQPISNGGRIFIHGLPKSDAEKFTIELRTLLEDDANICLRIEVNLKTNSASFNTCENGDWINKENPLRGECLLECDKPFLFDLTFADNGCTISINGQHHDVIALRVRYELATFILISGDLRLPGLHIPYDNMTKTNAISIPGNLQVGSVFTFTGQFLHDDRCSINFQAEESPESDIMFHFNPRFSVSTVVRNHKVDDEWGAEDRSGEFPFEKNHDFGMMIVPRTESYHIWVEGKKFAAFPHRTPLAKASILSIEGMKMFDISIDSPPDSMPSGSGFEEEIFRSTWKQDFYNPTVPLVLNITEGREGNIFCMSAVVPPTAERFHINFQTEPSVGSDIVFHYNPRFNVRKVILNSRDNGEWSENEVRLDDFPFREGSRFEIIMRFDESDVRVSVNNESAERFPFPSPVSRVKYILVNGDIIIKRAVFM